MKQGEVVVDLEIQEAQAFLDGAGAAFADLRLPLRQRDAAATAEVADLLARTGDTLAAAATRRSVASPATVEADIEAASSRLSAIFPSEWTRAGGDADFDVVASLLDQVEAAVAAGEYRQAESARLEAYAIFETGPEKQLLAFAPDAARRVEQLFWEGDGRARGLADVVAGGATLAEVRTTRQALDRALADGQQALGAGRTAPGAVVFNAATIVFREGLEAVLILASLLASMIGVNRRDKRPLALGALAALGLTALLFVLAADLLQALGHYGEKLEAVVSLVAIGVLLLVLNWFCHKVYWTRWIAKHHDRRRRLMIGGLGGQALGLVVVDFTSVFREGARRSSSSRPWCSTPAAGWWSRGRCSASPRRRSSASSPSFSRPSCRTRRCSSSPAS